MRSLVRSMLVLFVLAVTASPLAAPATTDPERARPDARVASRAILHGRDVASPQERPTSFDVFSQRRRPAGELRSTSPAPEPRAPSSLVGFESHRGDLDGAVPSDTIGALGDTFFVTAVNIRVAVYDRLGVEVVPPTLLEDLHPDSVGGFTFDPKVIYDQYNDTFVLVYLVQDDSPQLSRIIAVAIPNATATDLNTWCATSFPGDAVPGAPSVWADYPGLGYNEDRVTITSNQFTFPSSQGQFLSAQVMSIPKGPLYDCTQPRPVVPDVFVGTQTRDASGIQAFTLQPAQTVGTPASTQLLLSVQLAGRNSYLALWRIKETATNVILKKGLVPIGRTTFPPFGTQGGAAINNRDLWWDAGDMRLINAYFDADRNELFAAHAVAKNFKPDPVTGGYLESAARWYEVIPATRLNNSTLERKGTIGAPEVDVGWPSVATDASGNLFVTYSRAGSPAGEFLSAWVAEVGPSGTAATQLLLAPGLDTYDATGGPERWGDFTGINRDPVAPTNLATFNQYALDALTWQQVVNVVTHS
ncbi:MAG: hypothetical protein ACRDHC_02765 [Actinomycetota bacterium]